MRSTPLTRGVTSFLLMRSALTNLQSGLTFSIFPPKRLSALVTSCPDSMSLSTNQDPMNPAPPVTNTFLDSKILPPFQYLIFEFISEPGAALKMLSMHAKCLGSFRQDNVTEADSFPIRRSMCTGVSRACGCRVRSCRLARFRVLNRSISCMSHRPSPFYQTGERDSSSLAAHETSY